MHLLGNVDWRFTHEAASPDEIAARIRHELSGSIRLRTGTPTCAAGPGYSHRATWGQVLFMGASADLVTHGVARAAYIEALQAADRVL